MNNYSPITDHCNLRASATVSKLSEFEVLSLLSGDECALRSGEVGDDGFDIVLGIEEI